MRFFEQRADEKLEAELQAKSIDKDNKVLGGIDRGENSFDC